MKKIPTLFVREIAGGKSHLMPQVNPGCEWVLNNEGTATRKLDGTAVLIRHEGNTTVCLMRREVKPGKAAPEGFEEVQHDQMTGKRFGWGLSTDSGFHAMLAEAYAGDYPDGGWPEGTYELVGPKINGNPEHMDRHRLMRHGAIEVPVPILSPDDVEGAFDALRDDLLAVDSEGIVWHHEDGRMCKLKARDFRS